MAADHQLLEDALAAYLLGSGEPGEADMVRRHLEACASCRALASRLSRAVGALPLAVEEVAPPSRLRERILAAAAGQPQSAARDFARDHSVQPPSSSPFRARWPRARPRRWLPLAAAAALLLAIGVAAGAGFSRLTAPAMAAAHYSLSGTGSLAGAQAEVVEFRGTGTTLVEFSDLPEAPAGKVYQLWLIPARAKPVSGGVFVPESDGSKVLVLPRDLAGVQAMAVTVEAAPQGAPQPTQQPELSGSV